MAGGRGSGGSAGGTGAPRIDRAVITQLVDDLGADHVAELCTLFVAESRERVRAVRAAYASGDEDAAARSVHRLKSACGFLGAGGIAGQCREIEQLARDGRLDEVVARVDLVSAELRQASGELAALVGRPVVDPGTATVRS